MHMLTEGMVQHTEYTGGGASLWKASVGAMRAVVRHA